MPAADMSHPAEGPPSHRSLVIDLPPLGAAVLGAARLLTETVFVPTALLAVLLHVVGLLGGLAAAVGWCYLTVAVRWYAGRRMPGTLLLATGMLTGRACLAIATSSAFVYLLQPVLGSCCMAILFVGSALIGRPVTVRLARDFVAVPAQVLGRRRVRRMFRDVALLWGVSRLADAAMSLAFLHRGVESGLLARGLLSPVLTAITVLACASWGWRCLHRDGVRLRRHVKAPVPAA
jgi:hypothetical protein